MSSLTHKPEKGMATMIRSHHITEVLMFVSETKEHSGREAGHSQHLLGYTKVQAGDLERLSDSTQGRAPG